MTVAAIASCCVGVWNERGRARQTEPRGCSRKILRTPAVSQEQRDCEQPWVPAGGLAGDTADEHVEVVADMEFFEQRVQQPARQLEAARAFGQSAKVVEATVSSPVVNVGGATRPDR